MNPAHDTKNPPGQVREVDSNGVTKGFDRYPFLRTSSAGPEKAPISPAKRLGDIIDAVVARSSEPASKGYYDQGYKDGWDAAILQIVKKSLDNF